MHSSFKGAILNMTSQWWFDQTGEIIRIILLQFLIKCFDLKTSAEVVPVEMVVRNFMAKSSTSTSVYHNMKIWAEEKFTELVFRMDSGQTKKISMGPI